jgi:hypothetical protein
MDKGGHLIDLGDSTLSGNVRIFGEIDPEWEIDPKQIVFQEKVRGGWGCGQSVGACGTEWRSRRHVPPARASMCPAPRPPGIR